MSATRLSTQTSKFHSVLRIEASRCRPALMPLVGFLPAKTTRVRGTIAAVEKHLMLDGLVLSAMTPRVDDGVQAGERDVHRL